MALDLALAVVLLLAPLVRHFLEEGRIHKAVKFVDMTTGSTIAHTEKSRSAPAFCPASVVPDAYSIS
jgi:hypothetical protein